MRILGSKWKLFRFHLKQLGILLDHFGIVGPGRDKNIEVRDFHLKLKTVPGLDFPIGSYSLLMKIESATFSMNGTLTASLNKGFRQAVNSSIAFKMTASKGRKKVDYLLQSFTA